MHEPEHGAYLAQKILHAKQMRIGFFVCFGLLISQTDTRMIEQVVQVTLREAIVARLGVVYTQFGQIGVQFFLCLLFTSRRRGSIASAGAVVVVQVVGAARTVVVSILRATVQQVQDDVPLLPLGVVVGQIDDELDFGLVHFVREQKLRYQVQLSLHGQVFHVVERHVQSHEPIQRVVVLGRGRLVVHAR